MIFMEFTEYRNIDFVHVDKNKIWIQLDHVESVRECPNQADRSWIELSSGTMHEVDGSAEDILKDIVDEEAVIKMLEVDIHELAGQDGGEEET